MLIELLLIELLLIELLLDKLEEILLLIGGR